MKNLKCGSYRCQGGHVWLFEGTINERLSTVNCYAEKNYSQAKIDIMNKTKDLFSGKHAELWNMK